MLTIFAFIFIFGLLVFVHELGHFLMARRAGVKVLEFGFGFLFPIFKWKKGDTVYSINAIPLGGFVRLFGEDGKESKSPQSFTNKSSRQKGGILVAGIVMNFLLAVFLFSLLYAIGFKPIAAGMADHPGVVNNQQVIIGDVNKDSIAEKSGLMKNDLIVSVDGKPVYSSYDLILFLNQPKEGNFEVKVKRGEKEPVFLLMPTEDKEAGRKIIGVVLEETGKIQSKWFMAPIAGVLETVRLTKENFLAITGFFKQLFSQFNVSKQVSGPVGIISITGAMAKMGFLYILQFMAFLSVALAIFNILPIPALDGGHLFILGIEAVKRKELSVATKNLINLIGFAFLLLLIAVITINDIRKFF